MSMTGPRGKTWPLELRLAKDRRTLTIRFEGGEEHALTAEYLRVRSPSAEVRGHGPGQGVTVGGKREIAVAEIQPVGNYAVRLVFDDGHATGIYGWDYLLDLGRNQPAQWRDYLDEIAAKGLSREPPGR